MITLRFVATGFEISLKVAMTLFVASLKAPTRIKICSKLEGTNRDQDL